MVPWRHSSSELPARGRRPAVSLGVAVMTGESWRISDRDLRKAVSPTSWTRTTRMPTDPNKIFPPLPKGFSLPFYYASVNAIWVYYKVSREKVEPYLQDIALEPALFDGQALVLLHFQRYTGFI